MAENLIHFVFKKIIHKKLLHILFLVIEGKREYIYLTSHLN